MLLPQAASRATALVASLLLALTACAQVQPSSPTAPLTSPSATEPEPSASPDQSPSPEPVPTPSSVPLVTGLPTPWPSDYVTGKPIKFAGTGEKLDGLELFQPSRIAGRILGMATPTQVEHVLGVSRLRKVRHVIRPDLYPKKTLSLLRPEKK